VTDLADVSVGYTAQDFTSRGPAVLGYIGAERTADGVRFAAIVNSVATPGNRADFEEWVAERVHAYLSIGPERDGWTRGSTEDRAHLWCRLVAGPDMNFLSDPALLDGGPLTPE
jgi:hypothetical protein